jgi:Ca2+-binding RTX toxin-like protein
MPGFGSNTTVNGTNGADTLFGNDPAGNTNDIVYGHQGDDSIFGQFGYSNSTIYGGQGNDTISQFPTASPTGHNIIYGNLGNDVINLKIAGGDTVYGGQGDDNVSAFESSGNTIYGNLGNDLITTFTDFGDTFYGGQGNDTILVSLSNLDAIYGNQGNDLLFANDGITNTHEYGGQGDDTLVFTGSFGGSTTNDVETGGLGNDLFIATNDSGGGPLNVSDIVTVTDFLQGFDKLSETSGTSVRFIKRDGTGDSAAQALALADSVYAAGPSAASEYIFVFGGTSAGYLFYNGDHGGPSALSGMAILGATGEFSVNLTDITPSNFG